MPKEVSYYLILGFYTGGNALFSRAALEDSMLVTCPESLKQTLENVEPAFRQMIQYFFLVQFTELQEKFAHFKLLSPEGVLRLIKEPPQWLHKIPQHLLESYLDITPETFSHFKKNDYKSLLTYSLHAFLWTLELDSSLQKKTQQHWLLRM